MSLKSFALTNSQVAENYEINILQFDLSTPSEDVLAKLTESKVDLYAFTVYVWNMNDTLEVARKLKERFPERTVIVGGPEVSGMGVKVLNYDCFDYGFFGEGEESFVKFLLMKDEAKVPGLIYRKDNMVVMNPEDLIRNLDQLPLPYESEDYRNYLDNSPIKVRAAIETSRAFIELWQASDFNISSSMFDNAARFSCIFNPSAIISLKLKIICSWLILRPLYNGTAVTFISESPSSSSIL